MKSFFKKSALCAMAMILVLLLALSAAPAVFAEGEANFPTYEIGTENIAELNENLQTINISLSGQITMKFCFANIGDDHSYIKITVPNQSGNPTVTTLKKDDLKNGDGAYEVSVSLAAAQQTDLVELQWFNADNQPGKSRKYSVRYYADKIISLADSEGADEKMLKLEQVVKSMLNYGAMAQLALDYNTENLANRGLYSESNNPISDMLPEHLYGAIPGELIGSEDKSITFSGVQVFLRDTVRMRVYVDAPEGATATVNGENVTINKDEYGAYVGIYNIFATHFDEVFTVEVTANGQTATANYSVLGWCLDTLDSNATDEMKNAARAVYMYYTQTSSYVDPTHTPGATSCAHTRFHVDGESVLCSDCYKNISEYTRLSLAADTVELVAGVPTDVQLTLSVDGPVDLAVLTVTLKAGSDKVSLAYKKDSAIFGDGSDKLGGSVGRNIVIDGVAITEAGTLVTLTYTVTATETGVYKISPVVRGAIDSHGNDVTANLIASFETVEASESGAN